MLLLRLIKPEGSLQQESYTCNLGKRKKKKGKEGEGKVQDRVPGKDANIMVCATAVHARAVET